jgi:hypothetical protein
MYVDWSEAGPEERKKFMRDSAIAATIIVIWAIAGPNTMINVVLDPNEFSYKSFWGPRVN